MKRTEKMLKSLLFSILCLSIVIGLWITGSRDVHADLVRSKITVKTDRELYQGADIAAFLKGIRLTAPLAGAIKDYYFTLLYEDEGGVPTEVSSGKAKVGNYILAYRIELTSGNVFDEPENIEVKLNGRNGVAEEPFEGSHISTGYWYIESVRLYKVVFNARGGTPVPKTQWVKEGSTIKKPQDPTKEGYKFKYWGMEIADYFEPWDFSDLLGKGYDPQILNAVWEALPPPPTTTTTITTTTTEEPTTPEITETNEVTIPTETSTPDDLTDAALVASEETTPSDDSQEGGTKFPLLIIIVGTLLLTWTVALIVFSVLKSRQKKETRPN
ncbi:MAG TPA: InlB B-repeat-containing protein [Clostridiaceae bacterium]|nr:InlB B-repeat-containing protein [Clostridiaceae bacterium]